MDYQREVQCSEGEQVTLTVKVAGSPTPTVTWLFNGRKVKDDYSTEVGKDGSLTLITVESKHAGTYTFTVSNKVGSAEGCTKLVVRAEDEERASASRVESNPVTREKFGEYVSGLHTHNNGGFVVQFQVIEYRCRISICVRYGTTVTVVLLYIHHCYVYVMMEHPLISDSALWGGRPPDNCGQILSKQTPESI